MHAQVKELVCMAARFYVLHLCLTDGQLIERRQRICKLKPLNLLSSPFSSTQGGQGSPGGPGQHSGQDHSLCHRRLIPDNPGAHVSGGKGHLESLCNRDQAGAK